MAVGATPLRNEAVGDDEFSAPSRATRAFSTAVPFLTIALQVLEERVLLWLVTGGAGAIWTYSALHPDPWRIAVATLYSVTVLWPFLRLRRRER